MNKDMFISMTNIAIEVKGNNMGDKKDDFMKIMAILYKNEKYNEDDVADFLLLTSILDSTFFGLLFYSKIENTKIIHLTLEYYKVKYNEKKAFKIIYLLLDIYPHISSMNDLYCGVDELDDIRRTVIKLQSSSDDKEVATPALMKIIKDKREKNKITSNLDIDNVSLDDLFAL